MKNAENKKRLDLFFWIGLYITMIARYFMQGFQYYTYTDDNNQYGVYFRRAMQGDAWNNIILHYRRFFERPLAFFSDVYIFRHFFNNMHVLLIIMTTMYFLIILLLYRTFDKLKIRFGKVAMVFFALIPCAYEGAYWISASSRIIVSMFFATLSVWLFFGGITKINRKILIALSAISNLISLLYYEQTAIFSFVLFFICACVSAINYNVYIGKEKQGKIKGFVLSMIIPVVNLTITGIYYIYFMFFTDAGISESRNKLVSGNLVEKVITTSSNLIDLVKNTVLSFNLSAIKEGLKQPLGLALIIALAFLVGFMIITFASESDNNVPKKIKPYIIKLIVGVLLSFMPLTIFYLLENAYFEPRMLFPSLVGFAILLDLFFDVLTAFYKPLYILKRFSAAAMIIPFFLASTYITGVYKTTNEIDKIIASNFVDAYDRHFTEGTKEVYLLNTVYSYTGIKTPPLANITAADWIMLGNLNASQYGHYFSNLKLVSANGDFDKTLCEERETLVLGIDKDRYIYRLYLENNDLTTENGELFGQVVDGIFIK